MMSSADEWICVTQGAGAYGEAVSGGAHFLARLLRSAVTTAPAECHLMPVPRRALSNLKFVPLEHDMPPPGVVKVPAAPSCFKCMLVDACIHGGDSAERLGHTRSGVGTGRGPELPRRAERAGHVSR